MKRLRHRWFALVGALAAVAAGAAVSAVSAADSGGGPATATPIKHLVVIFDENVSFDHYFGTYPHAANPPGEPQFHAQDGTPGVNGLSNQKGPNGPSGPLLTNNPNESNPLLLDRSDAMTCDQGHGYTTEQNAADHGAEDLYAQTTGKNLNLQQCLTNENAGLTNPSPIPAGASSNFAVMDYYDGNTVTALWNYAQHFAMSDNAWGTGYGPSTPGALNVTAAQTYGAQCGPSFATINDSACTAPPGLMTPADTSDITTAGQPTTAGSGTTFSDADPTYDICSYLPSSEGGDGNTPATTITMGGNNIGAELSSAGLTWGWFEGGFDDGFVPGHGTAPTTAQICAAQHQNVGGGTSTDYIPHHEPFEYYASTANPMHTPPTSVAMIGHNDAANHQYDTADFWAAANSGNLPDVSYLKAPAYQDGHGGYSDPLDEQAWIANTINHLESMPSWNSTAVVITYDDSDGWYDHALAPIVNASQTPLDTLTNPGHCGSAQPPLSSTGQPEQGRCGYGPRLPFLVVSPWARQNAVSSTLIDQSSVVKFIEQNWNLAGMGNGASDGNAGSLYSMLNFNGGPAPALFLNPSTGEPEPPGQALG